MILDTNALSAFFDGEPKVLSVLSTQNILHLPVIVLGEYRFGLKSSRIGKRIEPQLLALAETCEVLPLHESTSHHYASIRHQLKLRGTPIPENDIWICALAREYRLPILTRDAHFDKVDSVERINY